jgi:hypothetical protein
MLELAESRKNKAAEGRKNSHMVVACNKVEDIHMVAERQGRQWQLFPMLQYQLPFVLQKDWRYPG